MIRTITLLLALGTSACIRSNFEASAECAMTAGCVSSFTNDHSGPIQQQAVAPVSAGALQPQ